MVELGDVVGSGPPEKRLQAIVAARMGRPPVMAHEQWPERWPETLPFLNERTLRVRSSPGKSLSESSLTSHAACASMPSFDVIPMTPRDRLLGGRQLTADNLHLRCAQAQWQGWLTAGRLRAYNPRSP